MLIEIIGDSSTRMFSSSIYEIDINEIICIEVELIDGNESSIYYYNIHLKSGLKIKNVKQCYYDNIISLRKAVYRDKKIDSIINE